jgi:predicted phosphoadenosine phosphosulfate sulfurtransferase
MPIQRFSKTHTVLDAARERIAFLFDHFEHLIVSISGGKDSSVLAHLALLEAKQRQRRIGLFFFDEEVMYQSSVDQAEWLMSLYPEHTIRLWLQIPFYMTNATSLTESQLSAWEPGQHKIWMRPKGERNIKAKPWAPEDERFRAGYQWLDFYGVIENFERCYKQTCFLVGFRAAGESPNRWRAVTKHPVEVDGHRVYWGTKRGQNLIAYPLYDWNVHDIWRYHCDVGLRYSKVYDWQFKHGFGIGEMRVSSLIHERSFKSLVELPEFEPKTYAKLQKRIKGIAFAQEAGRNAKMFRVRKLPKNFQSWIVYRDFLLETYPDNERKTIFVARFAKHLTNEYVARQQCRQLVLNDYENNLPIDNSSDPREALIAYYQEVL